LYAFLYFTLSTTDHVTSFKDFFTSLYKIKLLCINLSNNTYVVVCYTGIVHISQDPVLHNVL